MGRLIFSLTDEQRARLEGHRIRLGLRSHADVLRHWIDQGASAAPKAKPGSRLKGAKK